MSGHSARWILALIWLLAFAANAEAQTAKNIAGQTIVDAGAAAGGVVAPLWAQGIGDVSDAGNGISLLSKGDDLGFAQLAVNWATVQVEGTLGGPIAAGLAQGALDLGDMVIAPRLADALVARFPGIFIPAQTATVNAGNPFGVPSNPAASSGATKLNLTPTAISVSIQSGPGALVIPVGASGLGIQTPASSNSTVSGLPAIANGQSSNKWLLAIMNNPKEDLAARKIAAIALGLNPNNVTASSNGLPKTSAAASSVSGAQSEPFSPQSSTTKTANIGTPSATQAPGKTVTFSAPAEIPQATFGGPSTRKAPGGISLSQAAAERMPLDIALDAIYYRDGTLVLSGKRSKTQLDASLFLTTLRAACEDQDMYFSLDPDDGPQWGQQGEQAYKALWDRIKGEFESRVPARGDMEIKTVSASRDYASLWREIAPRYPNFRSKLVFAPEWLRMTRVGEILYKADVLLKELASGVPVLVPGKLRASSIEGYLSAEEETVAKTLVSISNGRDVGETAWRGSRLRFDLLPSPEVSTQAVFDATTDVLSDDEHLNSLLRNRQLIRRTSSSNEAAPFIVNDGSIVDLSSVRPRMFVRVHDYALNRDLSNHDPDLDGLAKDVSARFDVYAAAYEELSQLRDVFRAYVAAVQIVDKEPRVCDGLDRFDLLESEKTKAPLPEYRPSELFLTAAAYRPANRSRAIVSTVGSFISGGVSVAGRQFVEATARSGSTSITEEMRTEINSSIPQLADAALGRIFIRMTVSDLIRPKEIASTLRRTSLEGDDIENEPAAHPLQFNGGIGNRGAWVGILLIVLVGLALSQMKRTPRRKWR